VQRKRQISAEHVVRDLRAEITEQELRDKYKLADHRVRKLFKRLAAAGPSRDRNGDGTKRPGKRNC
jgi:hypothetical protein